MAILVDFSQVYLAPIMVNPDAHAAVCNPSQDSENIIYHMVINSLRSIQTQFSKEYGQITIACDAKSWRRDVFPNYKCTRRAARNDEKNVINWEFVEKLKKEIIQVLAENFPYRIVYAPGAEGDDVIGVLTKYITETSKTEDDIFGNSEPEKILIISTDRDNLQLQKYKNVKQYSRTEKKFVKPEVSARQSLIEKIVTGDSGDSIPSIKCGDDWFVRRLNGEKIRAPAITAAYLKSFFDAKNPIDACLTEEERRNYQRNEMLVSFELTPIEIRDKIISIYNSQKDKKFNVMKLMNFLIDKNMRNLLSNIQDFKL